MAYKFFYYDSMYGFGRWDDPANWYLDEAHVVPDPSGVPVAGDRVIIVSSNLVVGWPSSPLELYSFETRAGSTIANCYQITAYVWRFVGSTLTYSSIFGVALYGTCEFIDSTAGNYSRIECACTFSAPSSTSGCSAGATIIGSCVFWDNSFIDGGYDGGYISGDCVFNGNSGIRASYSGSSGSGITYYQVYGNCTFNDTSFNRGLIYGSAEFNDESENSIEATGGFAGRRGGVYSPGNCVFAVGTKNRGIFTGTLTTVGGSAEFNGNLGFYYGYSPEFDVVSGSSDVLFTGIE